MGVSATSRLSAIKHPARCLRLLGLRILWDVGFKPECERLMAFAAAFATQNSWDAFLVGMAASRSAPAFRWASPRPSQTTGWSPARPSLAPGADLRLVMTTFRHALPSRGIPSWGRRPACLRARAPAEASVPARPLIMLEADTSSRTSDWSSGFRLEQASIFSVDPHNLETGKARYGAERPEVC